jgi:hypothetical protein
MVAVRQTEKFRTRPVKTAFVPHEKSLLRKKRNHPLHFRNRTPAGAGNLGEAQGRSTRMNALQCREALLQGRNRLITIRGGFSHLREYGKNEFLIQSLFFRIFPTEEQTQKNDPGALNFSSLL